VRHVLLLADRLFAADVELFRERFPPQTLLSTGLGSTEAKLYCHWFIPRDRVLSENLPPVGYVRPDFRVTLVDADSVEVPPGEVGTIVVASRYIALGYWNDEAATSRAFAAGEDGSRVFRTGDLGRLRADGLLELLGREDRQIKIRGQRVEPDEVEAVIRMHPAVSDVAIIVRDDGDGPELIA
jgi:non-ribosomal peptide synthetase component F